MNSIMPWGMDFVSKVESAVQNHRFDHFGVTALERPLSMDVYRSWIEAGYHGSMKYLADHAQLKENPKQLAPRAISAIVLAKPYLPHPYPQENPPLPSLRTALYAQGEDYHIHFKRELEELAQSLRAEFPDHEFLCFTDSGPILERDLAHRAGLGWVGKNTCLIHPKKGSLFFVGQILTSLALTAKTAPVKDFCGTCDRCIRSCPTQAIEEPRKLNATKCISYWTIESPAAAPEPLREKFGNWFFGCDICQTVCPWNEKHHGKDLLAALTEDRSLPTSADLRWILNSSNKTLSKTLQSSPISRARPRGLKRNALQLIGNFKLSELRPEVERHLDDPHLGGIARWALAQLP